MTVAVDMATVFFAQSRGALLHLVWDYDIRPVARPVRKKSQKTTSSTTCRRDPLLEKVFRGEVLSYFRFNLQCTWCQ